MPSTTCRAGIVATVAAAALASSADLYADENKAEMKPAPHLQLSAATDSVSMEAGLEWSWGNVKTDIPDQTETGHPVPRSLRVRPYVRMPLTEKDSKRSQLDRNTDHGRFGMSAEFVLHGGHEGDRTSVGLVQARGEYGRNRFQYHPGGDLDATSAAWRNSWAAELSYRFFHARRGCQQAPQIRLRYDRSWKASDKVGIVIPGEDGAPDVVKDAVIEAPSVKPELSARLALPFTFGSEIGFGPSATIRVAGNGGGFIPDEKYVRTRFECFVYWFPSDLKNGGRIGITPFLSTRVSEARGADRLDKTEFGLVFDLRLGANLLEY